MNLFMDINLLLTIHSTVMPSAFQHENVVV